MTNYYSTGSSGKAQTNPNAAALKQYRNGWEKGDSSVIYSLLDMTYTYTYTYTLKDKQGKQLAKPVNRKGFKQFMVNMRKLAAAKGGPAIKSMVFMKFLNIKKRKVSKNTQSIHPYKSGDFL